MTARKGYSKRADVPKDLRVKLNSGQEESRTLAEILTVDLAELLRHAVPKTSADGIQKLQQAKNLGWLERTRIAGRIILSEQSIKYLPRLLDHSSDQVRGWGAVMIAEEKGLSLKKRLQLVRPLADDVNPGTRETAWIMLRPAVAADLDESWDLFQTWVDHSRDNIRRYASEITRPRGVWCAHLPALKKNPEPGLSLLTPLQSDPSRYVQNSVANWLNDAAKDNPDFVRRVTKDWQKNSRTAATAYICKRALRSL
jgi:3-methyladenine DNA glycosylase AlkC